jgi:hypothetical protein
MKNMSKKIKNKETWKKKGNTICMYVMETLFDVRNLKIQSMTCIKKI